MTASFSLEHPVVACLSINMQMRGMGLFMVRNDGFSTPQLTPLLEVRKGPQHLYIPLTEIIIKHYKGAYSVILLGSHYNMSTVF